MGVDIAIEPSYDMIVGGNNLFFTSLFLLGPEEIICINYGYNGEVTELTHSSSLTELKNE